jgi:hypothetical protein
MEWAADSRNPFAISRSRACLLSVSDCLCSILRPIRPRNRREWRVLRCRLWRLLSSELLPKSPIGPNIRRPFAVGPQACASPGHFDCRSDGNASFNQIYTMIADAGAVEPPRKVRRNGWGFGGMRRRLLARAADATQMHWITSVIEVTEARLSLRP